MLFLLCFTILISSLVIAEEDGLFESDVQAETLSVEAISADIYADIEEVGLQEEAGMTPDSVFYFVEDFMEGLKEENPENALQYKEEKIAEVREMIKAGKIDAAKKALQRADKYGTILQKEVSPKLEVRARESSKAVKEVLEEVEEDLVELEKEDSTREGIEDIRELMEGQNEQQDKIALAAKISSRIGELCEQLSELDPNLFYQNCRTVEDGPKWHEEMFEDLSDEQKKEAKRFAGIMKQCFSTSGKDCACEEIPYDDFANACSKAAPIAVACEGGDEAACGKLDSLRMPELPPHLQDVFDDLEDVNEERFDLHMPPECVKAGAKTPKDCGKVMIETHAPEECKDALLAANVQNEYEGREICDKIMMAKHAPECAEKGITDPEECKNFMSSFRGEEGMDHGGPRIDFNCREISDPGKRLECFDKATSQAESHKGFDDSDYDGGPGGPDGPGTPRGPGGPDGGHGDPECALIYCQEGTYCRGGECISSGDDDGEESECKDGCHQECGDQNTDCREGQCVCLGYGENGPPGSDGGGDDLIDPRDGSCGDFDCDDPVLGGDDDSTPGSEDESSDDSQDDGSDDTPTGDAISQPDPEPEPEPEPTPEPEPEPEETSENNEE